MQTGNIFHVLVPEVQGSLTSQLEDLRQRVDVCCSALPSGRKGLLFARIYLTDAANQWEQISRHPLVTEVLQHCALSYVEQPLLNGRKVALQLWSTMAENVQRTGNSQRQVVQVGEMKWLFHSVRLTADEARGLSAEQQTEEAFARHIAWLTSMGMNLRDHCHRTWLFVRDVDVHYAGVVKGRNNVFEREGLTPETHFIASTGIGGCTDNRESIVAVDFLSVQGLSQASVSYLQALEYLNPTHEYGVAFERATRLSLPGEEMVFISGTASIDKYGECLYRGDVEAQTDRLFLNIEKLLADGGMRLRDMKYAIVYLRDVADYDVIDWYMKQHYPDLPCLVVEARVCRPEWLIEVETIAVRQREE